MVEISRRRRVTLLRLNSRVGSRVKGMALISHVTRMGTMTSTCDPPQDNLETRVLDLAHLVLGRIVVMRVLVAVEIALCTESTMQGVATLGVVVVVEVEEMATASEAQIASEEA